MELPASLEPGATETIRLSQDRTVEVPKARPRWKPWTGAPVVDTYGGKAILDYRGEPLFAELVILRKFQNEGWDGVWVDTYADTYRVAYGGDSGEVQLPPAREALLERIQKAAGSRHGCFDIFCWKGDVIMFAEAKRRGRDRIRDTQKRWLAAALDVGVPLESFLIVEWSLVDG